METIFLKNIVDNNPTGDQSDLNAPFSFSEWKQRRPSFAERDIVFHYNRYLLDWFNRNRTKKIDQKFLLRQKYLYLLDQLQLFFSEEEKNIWYSKVNLSDEKELLLAIPYFAKKLKDISLYYLNLRKQIQNTKIEYNSVGSVQGLQQEIYRNVLKNFTSLNKELSPAIQTFVPQFSALQKTLSIEVQEVYDDKNYFDLSNTTPVSARFDLLHFATEKYFQTKGIVLSSDSWLFNCLTLSPTSNIDSFVANLTGNIFEVSDTNLYGTFIQNFLSENKYSLEFNSVSSVNEINEVSISTGNNYFYYPYGTTDNSQVADVLNEVSLSSIVINEATAGKDLTDSDTIFVKNGNDIQSAWLYYKEYEPENKTLKAFLNQDRTTTFIFPFPGYGLSGQDFEWTGASLETSNEYLFLPSELKNSVDNAYWSQSLSLDSVEPVFLNNTTLVSSGAVSNKNPNLADKFYLRDRKTDDVLIPRSELSGAWLFKFDKTSLPVSPNTENRILWPYQSFNLSEGNQYPFYLSRLDFNGNCDSISINDLDRSFFIAASSFDLADKIYKLNYIGDSISKATECCWLSSSFVQMSGYGFSEQNSFNCLFSPEETTRFLWTGPDTTIEEAFPSINHQQDCPFVTNFPPVSSFEWQKCTCKQVYYSPFGHPGRTFDEYNSFADCIAEDVKNDLSPFDVGSWKDSGNVGVNGSTQFAWYKTNSKHGWGYGKWVSGNLLSAAPFVLKRGKSYFYKRANSRSSDQAMPSYSINFKLPGNKTTWIQAALNADGTWSSTGSASQMKLNAGDFIKVDRRPATTSYLLSSVLIENISENTASIWSTFDTIAFDTTLNYATISWPYDNSVPIDAQYAGQYPSTSVFEITAYKAWKITRLEDGESQLILNTPVATFIPPTTGTYSIAVTAVKSGGQEIYESSIIPTITVVNQYETQQMPLDFKTPSSGFLIEQPLQGWNYSETEKGAKPYWAELYTSKNISTRFKGIYSWGYPNNYVDGYLPDHSPRVSPIELKHGSIVEYDKKLTSLTWQQPLTYKTFVGTPQWSQLSANTNHFSNLSSIYTTKNQNEVVVEYNTQPTNITLTNNKNGLPVEIFYYALSSFVWSISSEKFQDQQLSLSSIFFESPKPWTNLPNRFFPTIAALPTLEQTYTEEEVGGYFVPQNLGASQFINKDFEAQLKTLNLSGIFLAEDTNIHIGGRGRTEQDQDTLYTWEENNQWLKEPPTTNQLAGSVKKSLTKSLQTFIPYQTNNEETPLGLVTAKSKFTPWGGPNADQWTDVANEPKSFTGVPNVSSWVQTQILKQNKKEIDCWVTDIYGNQYALYKELDGVPVSERRNVLGELWTRTNNQSVNPANISLSSVYQTCFKTTAYNELTSNNSVKLIDCFFDTLLIELSTSALFIKIDYDYETAEITTIFDNIIVIENFDNTWFFPQNKKVITLATVLSGQTIIPELRELDINTFDYKKIFPIVGEHYENLNQGLSSVNATSVQKGCLHFNKTLQQYLITYEGTDDSQNLFVLDFVLENQDVLKIKEINWYLSTFNDNLPPVVSDYYLQVFQTTTGTNSLSVSASNDPMSWELLNYTLSAQVANTGVFTFNLPIGLHHVNYQVSNTISSSTYCLTLSVI